MKKKVYMAPELEVLEAKVEKGFAGSGTQPQSQLEEMSEGTDATALFS